MFALLTAVLIFVSNSIIRNSFITRSKVTVNGAVQFEAKDLRPEDFSLKDLYHANGVFNNFYERIKTEEIIRIKVWDYSGKVIFSDDASIIGQRFPDNEEFAEAIKGTVITEIGEKVKAENITEQGYEQLLEVYVPIVFTGEAVPSGVIEVYFKLDSVNSRIRETQQILFLTILAFTTASFGLLFIVFKLVIVKQLEKIHLQAEALDNASDHVIITDLDETILYVNKAAEKLTGYSKNEMLGNRPSLWGKQMSHEFYQKMWKTLKTDKKTFEEQITNKRKNGETYEAVLKISPILDNKDRVNFFVRIERDITRDIEIDKAKTEFVSMASHQLRTPLSTINWYAEMLLSGDAGKLSETQTSYIKESYKAGRRMNNLINVLLNLSGIKFGTFTIERKPVDMVALCNTILSDFKPEILDKKIKVELEFNPPNISIHTDPTLVKIIIENLLSNAVNFSGKNGTITLSIQDRENDTLIQIIDTGIGIPEKDQKLVFTKLFRAENAGKVDGTGFGLYTVRTIVENIGGKIWFKSTQGKGTTFYITLPNK